jgi:triphosphoribosyl-dephospho-CoA synthase
MLYPKPGLVSWADSGSHDDMHAETFMRSLFTLRSYFARIAQAGADAADFATLAGLGVAAEQRMLTATGGVNTHRGAIFLLGMLCAAAGRVAASAARVDAAAGGAGAGKLVAIAPTALRTALMQHWGADLQRHCLRRPAHAHGTTAALVHGIGGARREAADGMPAVFALALPVMQATLAAGRDMACARTDAFFALLGAVDDTNVYHRCGAEGARFMRAQAHEFIAAGGTAAVGWRATALTMHQRFVARRMSPGGAADLLAATCLVQQLGETGGARRVRMPVVTTAAFAGLLKSAIPAEPAMQSTQATQATYAAMAPRF